MIQKKCKKCGKEFFTYSSRLRVGKGLFCSPKCSQQSSRGRKPWNTGKKCPNLSRAKTGSKNPMWKGIGSKQERDKKYSQTDRGKASRRKANKTYSKSIGGKLASKRYRKKKSTDPHYKIRRNISNGIWHRLVRQRKQKKDSSILDCLPYTIDQLKVHLEKQFITGMTWDNYGKWHIDHIRPDSSFNYTSTSDKEFQESWALKNLQPLWAKDNIKKSDKIAT